MEQLYRMIKASLLPMIPRKMIAWRNPHFSGAVSITFDDGPHPVYTPLCLDLLKSRNIKATFFILGCNAERYPALVERMIEEGHEIGNHSYSHNGYHKGRLRNATREIDHTNRLIKKNFGYTVRLYRPPYGLLSLSSIGHCVRRGMPTVMWSIDSGDYANISVERILSVFQSRRTFEGDILLFHDHNRNTVEALNPLLSDFTSRCIRLHPVGDFVFGQEGGLAVGKGRSKIREEAH